MIAPIYRGAGGAYIAHFAMCAKGRCHPERSEGSRQFPRIMQGFFVRRPTDSE
jgi:hypothetical protein